MALQGQGLFVTYTAWDTANSVGKTGDKDQHTLNVTTDASTDTVDNAPVEVSNGEYYVLLTAAEMDGKFVALSGSSSTSDIVIIPVRIATDTKTGYGLATDGLDSISTTEPAGLASNFREQLVQLYRRFFGKATQTSTTLLTYKEDGTTPATTQAVSDTAGTETQGEAS